MTTYYYYINLDERGDFFADVRKENDETIVEFRDAEDFYEDGFGDIRSVNDVEDYLKSVGVINADDEVEWGE